MSKTKLMGTEAARAALDGSANAGAEMLPTEVSTSIIMRVWNESWARKLFTSITMKTQTMTIPKITAGITMQGTTGQTTKDADETAHTTDEITLTMRTFIGNAPIDKKTLAYAVPSLMPAIEEDIKDSVGDMEEDVFINGDTQSGATNINGTYHVTDYPGGVVTRDPRLELDGLRKTAQSGVTVNASGASLTRAHVLRAFAELGRYGKNKRDLVLLCSNSVEAIILGWEELRTIDKYGKGATVLTGEIGKLYGMTVISTSLVPDTLGSNGEARNQSSGLAGNRSVVLVFNKKSPVIGNPVKAERKFKVEVDDEPQGDRIVLVPKEDFAFANRHDEAVCEITNVLPGTI